MKGQVLDFDLQKGEGAITGEDGNRYIFTNSDWNEKNIQPKKGLKVDFETEENKAKNIYVDTHTAITNEKSKIVAGLLALFLGVLGIHKFYLGCNKEGIIMLLIWFFGLFLFGIPSIIIGIIAFIEALIYFFKSDEDFYNTYVAHKKCWF